MGASLTVSEAAALVGLEERTVRKEVEYGLFGSESPPRLKLSALVCLRVVQELGLQTTVAERKRIYGLIDDALAESTHPTVIKLSPVLQLRLDAVTEFVRSRVQRFELWKQTRVVTDAGIMAGEPVFAGSRLTVRHIGSLLQRNRADILEEIRHDYPYLTAEDIEFAKLYTEAYPKLGRPRASKASDR